MNLLMTVIFIIVWLLVASAARKGQQSRPRPTQQDQQPDLFDLEDLTEEPTDLQPPEQPTEQPIQQGPIPQAQGPAQPSISAQPLPQAPAIPPILAEEAPPYRPNLAPERIREAVVMMEILDEPLALRPAGRWWQ